MNERVLILERLQAAAEDVLGQDAPRLTEDTALSTETIDSLDLLEILMIIEDQEGTVIDGDAVTDVTDIRGVIDVIQSARATVDD